MIWISYAMFTVLQAVALIHLGWAFGMAWPAKSRVLLRPMVVGTPKHVQMPPAALTVFVSVVISVIGFMALWGVEQFSLMALDGFRPAPILLASFVFFVRGVATYLPFGMLTKSVEPFRTLDRSYFAPLCLLLSLGYFLMYRLL